MEGGPRHFTTDPRQFNKEVRVAVQTRFELFQRREDRTSGCSTKEIMAVGLVILNLFILLFSTLAVAADIDLGAESKLSIHGFLSQAYANSTGGVYEGIPQDGTTDYRNVALQFRYEYSAKDAFVLQFSDEQLGKSALQPYLGLGLNWVFYERQLLEGTTVKVGKFPIPMGIYNEVLHVGTVLPFYRPPFGFYGDGGFSSETISGVGFYQAVSLGQSWSAEADLYAGEFTFYQYYGPAVTPTRSNNALGTQFWLYTPIEGVRFGLGGYRATDSNLTPPHAPSDKVTDLNWYASLDANLGRYLFQSEWRWWKVGKDWTFRDYYVLTGVKLTKELMLSAEAEIANIDYPGYVSSLKIIRDYGVGVRYAFRPNLMVKAETHLQKGYDGDEPTPDIFGPPIKTDYYIISLAASF